MSPPNLRALAEEIERLSAPDKLRFAAGLLEKHMPQFAHTVIERVTLEPLRAELKRRGVLR
jgi:hypothetical protein